MMAITTNIVDHRIGKNHHSNFRNFDQSLK